MIPPTIIHPLLEHFTHHYTGLHGLLTAALDGKTGRVIDESPILDAFGLLLPHLALWKQTTFVRAQLESAQTYTRQGLIGSDRRVDAPSNLGYLSALIAVSRLWGDAQLLDSAEQSARALWQRFGRHGYLLRSIPASPILARTSPFNGGSIELYVDLGQRTGRAHWIDIAEAQAQTWIRNPFFVRTGLFRRVELAAPAWVSSLANQFAAEPLVRLMKDNSNLLMGLIALYRVRPTFEYKQAILHWVKGMKLWLLEDDYTVMMQLSQKRVANDPDLRAASAVVDILLDIFRDVDPNDELLELATLIARRWLKARWDNDLFPLKINGTVNHLEADLDFAISLCHLSTVTEERIWHHTAEATIDSLLRLHRLPYGYALTVNADGKITDNRIIVKYQGLLLKAALLDQMDAESDPIRQTQMRVALRDR